MDRNRELEEVRGDIAETRMQMADTLAELEARVSGTAQAVKRTLNPLEHARAHPLPALAVALGAGVALGASGADRRAAAATVTAGRRAPKAATRAAREASRKAADVAHRVAHRNGDAHGAVAGNGARRGGPLARLTGKLWEVADARLAEIVQEAWRAAIAPSPSGTGTRPGARP